MSSANTTELISLDEDALRHTVAERLSMISGRTICVRRLERTPCSFATLFPAEILSITLDNGSSISLFLKHMGSEQDDHPNKQCRDREVRIYEELLGDDRLPVVKYYGSHWNSLTHRHEVFLEYIDDWNLRYHHMEHWFAAARRLADLHRHFAERSTDLVACDYLLHLDERYHCAWADRALDAVARQSPALATQLKEVVADYAHIASVLASQPPTLVHNDLGPKNVIVDRSCSPPRITFIDWEMAGVGCGLIDLTHLTYGRLDADNDRRMREAYCNALSGTGLLPSDPAELARLSHACELDHTLYRLARCQVWGRPFAYTVDRVKYALHLWDAFLNPQRCNS